MSMISSLAFLSAPISFSDVKLAGQQKKAMNNELQDTSTILMSDFGTASYKDTIDAGAYMETELKLSTFPKIQVSCDRFQGRYAMMKEQLDQSLEIASTAKQAMMRVISNDTGANYDAFIGEIKSCLNSLTLILNRKDGLNFLLAGVAEDQHAVKQLDQLAPISDELEFNTISKDYYLGQESNMPISLLDTTVDKFPLSAEHEFFAKIIQSCRICLGYTPGQGKKDVLTAAQDMCDSAKRDYLVAKQSVEIQLDNINFLLEDIPKQQGLEMDKQKKINNQDQLMALYRTQQLQNSRAILEHIQSQKALLAKQYAESFGV